MIKKGYKKRQPKPKSMIKKGYKKPARKFFDIDSEDRED